MGGGKRRRKSSLSSSSSSDLQLPDPPPSSTDPMDSSANPASSDLPLPSDNSASASASPSLSSPTDDQTHADPRSCPDHARKSDPRSTSDPARTIDPRLSSEPARTSDPRTTSAPSRNVDSRPNLGDDYLDSAGSYLVVEPSDDTFSFRKINVFWPEKQIYAICGAVDVQIEAPANGTLIIKTSSRVQTKALLKTTVFCGKKVKISLHRGRNSCQGTVFAPELRFMTEDEILSDLRGDGVTHIRRITTFRDGQRRDTNLLVLTFNSTSLPESLNIGYLKKDVKVFIPNPLRCFQCHRFGHGSRGCQKPARCMRCGMAPHEGTDCTIAHFCISCNSPDHLVSSSQCPTWKDEKRICELKAKENLSYPEARRRVNAAKPTTPTPGRSYAQAARVQTTSCSTQTEPLSVLPPLQLLKPLTATQPAATSDASTESMITEPASTQDTPSDAEVDEPPATPSPVVSRPSQPQPRLPSRDFSWKRVQSSNNKTSKTHENTNVNTQQQKNPQGNDRLSRPPVRISMGQSRSNSWTPPTRAGGGPSHK